MQEDSKSILERCLKNSFGEERQFKKETFRRLWLSEKGESLYFLFRKNVRVTNLQHLELGVLLRSHATKDNQVADLRIEHTSLFLEEVRELADLHMASYLARPGSPPEDAPSSVARTLVRLYGDIWSSTVGMDQFLCSAAVYIPSGIAIDLVSVCGASGYLHSIGRTVYAHSVSETGKRELFTALEDHFVKRPATGRKAALIPFAHEDFIEPRLEKVAAARNGLADVKLHVTKFFIGSEALVDVIREIGDHFREQLSVCPSGDYQESRRLQTSAGDVDSQRTVWMIADWELGDSAQTRGQRWFVCYEQLYGCSSPFEIFDENKFAWVDHTTMPHSMAAALLNLATKGAVGLNVIDPFAGSGTVGFESARQGAEVVQLSDAEPLMGHVWRDNVDVLSSEAPKLKGLADEVLAMQPPSEWLGGYEAVKAMLAKSFAENCTLSQRALYYIALRVLRRHAAEMGRAPDDRMEIFLRAFEHERSAVYDQLVRLERLRRRKEVWCSRDTSNMVVEGDYANEVTTIPAKIAPLRTRNFLEIKLDDQTYRSTKLRADVMVTDPPYGFNTKEDPSELAQVYRNFVRACLQSGVTQIVVCLMAKSFIGNDAPVFTRPDFIEKQFQLMARELQVELRRETQTLPGPDWLVRDRYYWESERALRREVLHFVVGDRR